MQRKLFLVLKSRKAFSSSNIRRKAGRRLKGPTRASPCEGVAAVGGASRRLAGARPHALMGFEPAPPTVARRQSPHERDGPWGGGRFRDRRRRRRLGADAENRVRKGRRRRRRRRRRRARRSPAGASGLARPPGPVPAAHSTSSPLVPSRSSPRQRPARRTMATPPSRAGGGRGSSRGPFPPWRSRRDEGVSTRAKQGRI